VGCKDGTIRTILFKPNDYKSETPMRKWFPHENNSVRTMSMSGGLMITNSNDNILKVWDIEGMIS
jgi:WD40 repeat protein